MSTSRSTASNQAKLAWPKMKPVAPVISVSWKPVSAQTVVCGAGGEGEGLVAGLAGRVGDVEVVEGGVGGPVADGGGEVVV